MVETDELVVEIVDALRRRGLSPSLGGDNPLATGRIDLNEFDEVIRDRAVSYEQVEAIIEALEGLGLSVGDALGQRDVELMKIVMAAARDLRKQSGRSPTVAELSEHLDAPEYAVRRALEYVSRSNKPGCG